MFGSVGNRVVGGIAGVALTVLAAGCSGEKEPGPTPKTGPTSGSPAPEAAPLQIQPVELREGKARMELLALDRTGSGKVVARFRLVSEAETGSKFDDAFKYVGETGTDDLRGISLVDGVGNKLYFPLRTTDDVCLCTDLSDAEIPAGGSLDLYAVYPALPQDVKAVTVRAPLTVPFHDVPVSDGPAATVPGQTVDPESAALAPPVIRPLVSNAEGIEQSIDEEGDDKRVRISADVLFKIDKADLGSEAQRILKGVAEQIDESPGDVVKIDGHTDDTGTPAHNQDLSERRATSVENALKQLVTRKGVTFQSRGYGEDEPVASNGTEEGRRLNRRVAVGFARPVPARPAAPPAQSSGSGAFQWSEGAFPVIATLRPKASDGANDVAKKVETLQYDVNAIHRDSAGLVSLVWTVTNKGTEEINVNSAFHSDTAYRYKIVSTSGVSLIEAAAKVGYGPLRDDTGVCLCFQGGMSGNYILAPGENATYSSLYKLPEDLPAVDVQIPFHSQSHTIPNVKVG